MDLRPQQVVLGGAAGAVATAPMTALMEAAFRRLPRAERYPLPPREILEELSERTHAPLPEDEEQRMLLALVAHFGYGAACGAIYGLGAPRSLGAAVTRGVVFGMAVWAGSYLGWLPAFGVLRPATQHPVRRTALMVAAHLLWGASTGALTYLLAERIGPGEIESLGRESTLSDRVEASRSR